MKDSCIFGFRCSANDYAYVALAGSKAAPTSVITQSKKYPKGYSTCSRLKWFQQELENIFSDHKPKYVAIKADESRTKSYSSIERALNEAIVFLAVADTGSKGCRHKRASTIAKDLGVKGKASYLKKVDTSAFPDFESYDDKLKDAVFCAWSELP